MPVFATCRRNGSRSKTTCSTRIESFPDVIVARALAFRAMPYYSVTEKFDDLGSR